ncbi:MAG: hypothetical protein LBF36_03005, partial [Mycoplasmataceae bacterium]|nr:hypothetical protein [Mycoplasmataceae bacterium]
MIDNQTYLKWKKHRRHIKVWTSILCGTALVGAGLGVAYAIWYSHKQNDKPTSIELTRLLNTDDSILKRADDEIVLQAMSANGKQAVNVTWSGLKTINGIKYDEHIPSILIITTSKEFIERDELRIEANDGVHQTHEIVAIGSVEFKKIP